MAGFSVTNFAGIADEHNFSTASPPNHRPEPGPAPAPVPVAKPAVPVVLPSAEIKVKPSAEAKRTTEPQQWTGLSSQIATEYQHEDECRKSDAPPPASAQLKPEPAAAPAPKTTIPVLLPSATIKPKADSAPVEKVGPQQWTGLSASMAAEYDTLASESPELRRSAPTAQHAEANAERKALPPAVSDAAAVGGGAGTRATRPAAKSNAGPQQWQGISSDLENANPLNSMPSPENSRQRQRRLTRELEEAKAEQAAKAAQEAEENKKGEAHAKPADPTVATGSTYYDFSPLSVMGV